MEKKRERSGNTSIDKEQFEQLYKRYYPRLKNFALQFTSDEEEARDMVHEVFMKFWETRNGMAESDHGALLYRMTRNLCLNHVKHLKVVQNKTTDLRKLRTWEELYRIEFQRDEPILLIEQELEQQVEAILRGLPEKCREVFVLSRVKDLKNNDIALQLGISVKAVEKHISRALKDFRDLLPVTVPVSVIILIVAHITG